MAECGCSRVDSPRRVVLTGGPGAGKTAVLELVRRSLCRHVRILPESASVVFGGGFPRDEHEDCRRAAQRAIFHVQRELEAAGDAHAPAIALCDRGTVDGLAYWPGTTEDFWNATATTIEAELGRYDAVLHLRTPTAEQGYNHQNPLRTESDLGAAAIDMRILAAWQPHPRRHIIESTSDFMEKATTTLDLLRQELPTCCGGHLDLSSRARRPSAQGRPLPGRSAGHTRRPSGPLLQRTFTGWLTSPSPSGATVELDHETRGPTRSRRTS